MAICMEDRDAEDDSWEDLFEKAPLFATPVQLASDVVQNPHSHMAREVFE
jgi:crotonobetainyl-CoA:carnitine CoA-transferase CaiB-like acyl-CoA transferase